ncbi:DUF5983 family protein [Azorhizobium oxalatiphilum]|uniref:DUF5983 family protein n=1 Tax=Azorhizobium oxalatiphilum TaxID=980631 RepID=UPI001664199B|nr:hypothetical protein [Azorhizobium oxalatiphilum]
MSPELSDQSGVHNCAIYLGKLHAELRSRLSDEEWACLFAKFPTPAKVQQSLLLSAAEGQRRKAFFWSLLDVSTAHLTGNDCDLLGAYRGPGRDMECDRDPGQSLHVTPCVSGWIISTSGCVAPVSYDELKPQAREVLDADRQDVIERMTAEGFSNEFIALFTFAFESGAADIRFHQDAECLPGFPLFDGDDREADVQATTLA